MTAILSKLDDFDSVMATAILMSSDKLRGVRIVKKLSDVNASHGDVYVVDMGITARELNEIRAKTNGLVYVFDHHPKTYEDFDAKSTRTLKISKDKNSMELALEYAIENGLLSPVQIPAAMILSQASEKEHVPTETLLAYVYYVMHQEDDDLKLRAAARLLNFETMARGTKDVVEEYRLYKMNTSTRVKAAKLRKQVITLEDNKTCAVVNADPDITDAIAYDLKSDYDLVVVWRLGLYWKAVAQFRSSKGIARKYAQELGGDGHYNAAGVVVDFHEFAEKYLGIQQLQLQPQDEVAAVAVPAETAKKTRAPANEKHAKSVRRILGEFHGIVENQVASLFGGDEAMKKCIAQFRSMNLGNDDMMKCLLFCHSFTASHAARIEFDSACRIAQENMNNLCKTMPRRVSRYIRLNDFVAAIGGENGKRL
jgi:nanoRNase/pAp phosphatase (c-di-AMP/oligoRNAs hydrolase)